jgi:hypothetical protein
MFPPHTCYELSGFPTCTDYEYYFAQDGGFSAPRLADDQQPKKFEGTWRIRACHEFFQFGLRSSGRDCQWGWIQGLGRKFEEVSDRFKSFCQPIWLARAEEGRESCTLEHIAGALACFCRTFEIVHGANLRRNRHSLMGFIR